VNHDRKTPASTATLNSLAALLLFSGWLVHSHKKVAATRLHIAAFFGLGGVPWTSTRSWFTILLMVVGRARRSGSERSLASNRHFTGREGVVETGRDVPQSPTAVVFGSQSSRYSGDFAGSNSCEENWRDRVRSDRR